MDFRHSEIAAGLCSRFDEFINQHVFPVEHRYRDQVHRSSDPGARYRTPPILQELKEVASAQGL